jgi:hypothetical protein
MAWLFNTNDLTWHNWYEAPPDQGDEAWCGLPFDSGSMGPTGGSAYPNKCQVCLDDIILSGSL